MEQLREEFALQDIWVVMPLVFHDNKLDKLFNNSAYSNPAYCALTLMKRTPRRKDISYKRKDKNTIYVKKETSHGKNVYKLKRLHSMSKEDVIRYSKAKYSDNLFHALRLVIK